MKTLMLLFSMAILLAVTFAEGGLPNDFDYKNHGTDWEDNFCNNLKARTVLNLSPLDFDPKEGQEFSSSYYYFPKYVPTEANINPSNITVEFNATEEFGKAYTITSGFQMGIYQATSLRIHSESEHRFEGKSFPVELQIYHKLILSTTPADNYKSNLFISVFFDDSVESKSNDVLANITNAIKEGKSTATIDLSNLLDLSATRKKVYTYGGTQTIPPCLPASWFVFPEPFHASSEEIKILRDLYYNNPDFSGQGNFRQPPEQPEDNYGFYLINGDAQSAHIDL